MEKIFNRVVYVVMTVFICADTLLIFSGNDKAIFWGLYSLVCFVLASTTKGGVKMWKMYIKSTIKFEKRLGVF
jgi:hypothetical protein